MNELRDSSVCLIVDLFDWSKSVLFRCLECAEIECNCFVSNGIFNQICSWWSFLCHFEVIDNKKKCFCIFIELNRICFCLDLIAWFIGTLHLFTAFERLGPKLLMILNTVCWFSKEKEDFYVLIRWKICCFLFVLSSYFFVHFRLLVGLC